MCLYPRPTPDGYEEWVKVVTMRHAVMPYFDFELGRSNLNTEVSLTTCL